MYSTWVDPS
uniref:Uncharacterized protein n=1 Tax=Arundo donax TaxID=35708 RepID=A0A0A9HDA3_ARUDO